MIASLSSTLPVTKNQSTMPCSMVACTSVKCIRTLWPCSDCPCGHPVDVGQGGAAEEVRAILMKLRASRFCGGGCKGPPPLQIISRVYISKFKGCALLLPTVGKSSERIPQNESHQKVRNDPQSKSKKRELCFKCCMLFLLTFHVPCLDLQHQSRY